MLDGLLGRGGFSSKCKSLMKLTKTRIDVIRRKRNATQRFLRKDVADLLSNGLDINAYGRAEGLLLEVILSSCYDFVERCCDVVAKHLSIIQKHGGQCPEECKSAVASLMIAAARFSDLPELRDLRQLFYERFGDSLALSEDPDFKENMTSPPCTLENKVRLMKEIASEFSIKWDSKAFEQRMLKPPISPKEPPKAHRQFLLAAEKNNLSHGKDKVPNGNGHGIMFKDRPDHHDARAKPRKEDVTGSKMDVRVDFQARNGFPKNGHDKSLSGLNDTILKRDVYDNTPQGRREYGPDRQAQVALNVKEVATPRTVRSGSSSQRKVEPLDIGPKFQYIREDNVPIIDNRYPFPHSKQEIVTPHPKISGKEKSDDDIIGGPLGTKSSSKDEVAPKPKSYHNMVIPPPYVKRYDKAKVGRHDAHLVPDGGFEAVQQGSDHRHNHHHEKDQVYQDETANPVPKPRSARRRHSRSHSFQSEVANFEESAAPSATPRKSRSKRRDESRRGLQVLFDDEHREKDEEERIIDRLLIHYSKKPSSGAEAIKPRRKSRSRHAHHGESAKNGSGDGSDKEMSSSRHSRSVSLPREHSGPLATTKVFTRAATFHDEARHVHPKLPDYDDLAARFAALRGR